MSGNAVWTAVDGFTGATPLGLSATGGMEAIEAAGYTWQQTFIGLIPGSLGETSTIACLIGAALPNRYEDRITPRYLWRICRHGCH